MFIEKVKENAIKEVEKMEGISKKEKRLLLKDIERRMEKWKEYFQNGNLKTDVKKAYHLHNEICGF